MRGGGPCKGCTRRWIDTVNNKRCHTDCEEYKQYTQKVDELNDAHKQDTMVPKYSVGNMPQRRIHQPKPKNKRFLFDYGR